MSTTITSDCINCGACEPECPNTAIYGGGVQWELNGELHPAIAQDIYYIVPSKCTECVGFHDHEACAAVCPVDCCVPDPQNPETHEVLLQRARQLHPEQTIGDDAPSRFHKDGAESPVAAAPANAPSQTNGAAVAAPAVAAAPKPAAPAAAAPAPAPAARAIVEAPAAMMNLPKDIGALPGPIGEKHFDGELDADFEDVLASVDLTEVKGAPIPVQIAMRLGEPILGAMPDSTKANLEAAVGNRAAFSRVRSTALNTIVNAILYPALLLAFAVVVLQDPLFSQAASGWILLGVLIAVAEAAWRMREGVLHGKPADQIVCRATLYGIPLAPLGAILARGQRMTSVQRKVAFEGYTVDMHDPKTERDRRYGTVYTVSEHANAYLVRIEMPRKLPPSSLKRLWNLPDEMPDYDYNITLADSVLSVRASVRGEALRRLCHISPSFPADFTTRIDFDKMVSGFRHRLRNKVLEIVVLKDDAQPIRSAA